MKKSLAVVLAGSVAGTCVHAQVVLPGHPLGDLRSVLKQAAQSSDAAGPRQLSPEERARLRRQLSEQQQQQQQQAPGSRSGKGA